MTAARDFIAAALREHLPPEITVLPYGRDLEAVDRPVVMVRADGMTPSTQPQCWISFSFAVIAVIPTTLNGPADDQIDDLALEVIYALEKTDLPAWTAATRGVHAEKYPAFEITLTADFNKEND